MENVDKDVLQTQQFFKHHTNYVENVYCYSSAMNPEILDYSGTNICDSMRMTFDIYEPKYPVIMKLFSVNTNWLMVAHGSCVIRNTKFWPNTIINPS